MSVLHVYACAVGGKSDEPQRGPEFSTAILTGFAAAGAEELVKGLLANKGNLQKHPDQIGVGMKFRDLGLGSRLSRVCLSYLYSGKESDDCDTSSKRPCFLEFSAAMCCSRLVRGESLASRGI